MTILPKSQSQEHNRYECLGFHISTVRVPRWLVNLAAPFDPNIRSHAYFIDNLVKYDTTKVNERNIQIDHKSDGGVLH